MISPLFLGFEPQRSRINAIPLAGWGRTVWEYMAQVRIALGTQHLGALHEETVVGLGAHIFCHRGRGEAWPSSAGIEFLAGAEEFGAAAHTPVDSRLMVVPIAAGEG